MLSLKKPTTESIRRFLAKQAKCDVTYTAVGATAHTPPSGYTVDHTRIKLGGGERAFESAKAALERWQQFQLGWIEAWPPDTPILPGEVVAVLGRACGLWWLNSCRIVYVVDEKVPVSKFGFAYGTLPGHMESGEERFMVEWNQSDNSVWYEVLAFFETEPFVGPAWPIFCTPYSTAVRSRFGGGHVNGRSLRRHCASPMMEEQDFILTVRWTHKRERRRR